MHSANHEHLTLRGSGYLCRLSDVDQMRLVGIFSNLNALTSRLFPGWPRFTGDGVALCYMGPLTKHCSLMGLASDGSFNSAASPTLGKTMGRTALLGSTLPTLLGKGPLYDQHRRHPRRGHKMRILLSQTHRRLWVRSAHSGL